MWSARLLSSMAYEISLLRQQADVTSRRDYTCYKNSRTPRHQIDYLHREFTGQNKNLEHFDETVLVYRMHLVLNISIYQSFFARSEISEIVAQGILV